MMARNYYCNLCDRKAGAKECTFCVQADGEPSEYRPRPVHDKANTVNPHTNDNDEIGQTQKDAVNHPNHYQTSSGLEAIDVIEAFISDMKGIEAFCTGNAMKYLCRWKKKNGVEDLKKAQWYLNRLIEYVQNQKWNKSSGVVFTPNDILICGKSLTEYCKELEKENK